MSGPQPRTQRLAEVGHSIERGAPARGHGIAAHLGIRHAPDALTVVFSDPPQVDVHRFIDLLLTHDENAAHAYAANLVSHGVSAERLYEGLFADAARTLGEMWACDDCTFYDVTLGTGRIQRLVREFAQQFAGEMRYPGSTGRLLLCSAADEQHSLGIAVLAEFFVRDGWDVHVGPGLGSEALLDRVRDAEYQLLGFSVAVTSRLAKLQQDIRRARQVSRNSRLKVIVGGALISEDPSLAERIGADGYALDATSALAEARRLLSA